MSPRGETKAISPPDDSMSSESKSSKFSPVDK